MIRLDVNRLLKMRGVKFGNVWLSKRGFSYKQARRLLDGSAKSVGIDHLFKLCKAFECTPNELFRYEPDGNEQLSYLAGLMRGPIVHSPQDLLENLSQAEVERLMKQLEEMRSRK
ncbi:MAG: helix-turn-helix transcriptional regulator [Flavobacteriales bacterium]|nr:helix-turn-helix transcriptional regulator [Flavobacteriales bacterium]